MSNATHTPGPWNVSRHATPDYAPQFGIYAGESARDLATVTGDNAAADAALIEAAPDLLAACEAAAASVDCPGASHISISVDSYNTLVAAIAKARNA